jgi:hypothetical protein
MWMARRRRRPRVPALPWPMVTRSRAATLVDELTASYRSLRAHAAISGSRAGDRAPDVILPLVSAIDYTERRSMRCSRSAPCEHQWIAVVGRMRDGQHCRAEWRGVLSFFAKSMWERAGCQGCGGSSEPAVVRARACSRDRDRRGIAVGREPSNVDGEAAAATTSASIAVADGNAITSSDLVDELTASYRSLRAHAAISGSRAGDRAPDDCPSI